MNAVQTSITEKINGRADSRNFEITVSHETTDAVAVLTSRVNKLMQAGAGHRKSLYNVLGLAYDLMLFMESLSEVSYAACEKELKKRCIDEDVPYSSKSKPEHAFIRLTLGDAKKTKNPHLVSQYARLLRIAHAQRIETESFATWVENEGGIVKILNPHRATAKASDEDVKAFVTKAQNVLKKRSVVTVPATDADMSDIAPVTKKTTTLAVVERFKDGSFTVRGFVPENEGLLNSALAEIGRTL